MRLGRRVTASAEFTRPANTTAYAAKDVVCDSATEPTVLTFSGLALESNGTGKITKAVLMTDKKDCTSVFRLHLYHTTPTPINDNSPYLLLYADRAKRIGSLDWAAAATEDATNSTAAMAINATVSLALKSTSDSSNVIGVLETVDGFTPASGQKFFIELTAESDAG